MWPKSKKAQTSCHLGNKESDLKKFLETFENFSKNKKLLCKTYNMSFYYFQTLAGMKML